MTFIEAAIEILQQVGRPLHVHELTERALKQKLLSHQGRTPEVTMQSRLAQETKKGDRTPLVQKGQGTFGLRSYERSKPAAKSTPAKRSETRGEPRGERAESRAAEPAAESAEGGKRRRRRRGGRSRKDDIQVTDLPEAGTPEEAIVAQALGESEETDPVTDTVTDTPTVTATPTAPVTPTAPEPPPPPPPSAPASDPPIVDLDALQPIAPRRYPRIVELPPEEALAAEYADEIAGGSVGPPAAEEVLDAQSADEDRPLLAEIKEERDRGRGRGRDRDRRGKSGRDRRGGKDAAGADKPRDARPEARHETRPEARHDPRPESRHDPRPEARTAEHAAARNENRHEARHEHRHDARPPAPPAPAPTPRPPVAAPPASLAAPAPRAPSGSVADIAVGLLRSLNDPRPVHARQLAAMAVKRKLLAGEAEDLWRTIRAALIADARERHSLGMRARARAHGGGLFALASGKLDEALRGAEESLAARLEDLVRATREGLRAALTRLSMGAIEQVARLYLERSDLRDVERVKRTGETTYLGATRRDGKKILVGVRTGGAEVGRHSVGELRAGVEAKGCAEGLLLAAGRLGTEGARELTAAGPPVIALVGDELADALIRAGVAVQRASIPVIYLDVDLLTELGE